VDGLCVETADALNEVWPRFEQRPAHLLILKGQLDESELVELRRSLLESSPLLEVILVSDQPEVGRGIAALRSRMAHYLPWPPDELSGLVPVVHQILQSSRQERLMENLMTVLFWATQSVVDPELPVERFDAFRALVGMERILPLEPEHLPGPEMRKRDTAEIVLGDALDSILSMDGDAPDTSPEKPSREEMQRKEAERRAHFRIQENQFIRYRPKGHSTSIVAYLGDLSEGGAFIQTPNLRPPGLEVEVDMNLEHDGLGYLVRCHAEVAWVAEDDSQSPLGVGFGVRFVNPPSDVMILLQRVVRGYLLRKK
jgi:hypothetical protein